jgi:type I restriction-modification system DNA methylase subunit
MIGKRKWYNIQNVIMLVNRWRNLMRDDYFSGSVKILKPEDLIEIKNSNEFKKLLKETLYYELKNYGVAESEAFDMIVNAMIAKVYDEILFDRKPNHELEFQIKPEDFTNINDFYNRINKLFKNALIELLGEDPKVVNQKEIINHQNKVEILLKIVSHLQRIRLRSLRFLGEDLMGDIFLDFMGSIYKQSRGMFFTHPNICKFVCQSVGVKDVDNPKIIDPSCGSGAFLVEAYKENTSAMIVGMDNNVSATKICKINMAIHETPANIYTENALLPLENLPFLNKDKVQRTNGSTFQIVREDYGFDFILSNPPFSVEITKSEYKDVYRMIDFVPSKGNSTTASECLFVERWFQLLNPDGKIGVVFPIALFDSPDYLKARLLFLCYFQIIAIIGLPEYVFSPYAQQRTVLVFGKRRNINKSNDVFKHMLQYINENDVKQAIEPIKNEKIIFYNAKDIGYVRQKKQSMVITNSISENDLSEDIANIISKAFNGFLPDSNDKIAVLSLQELAEKRKFILTPNTSKISQSQRETFILQDWEIIDIKKSKIDIVENLLLCETGDIVAELGIIKPKKLSNLTPVNKQRLLKKIKSGKFGYLQEGDVIIAPVRVYQKKIAVVTKNATRFLFSSDFIVLRKKYDTNLLDSFVLFYSLIQDENIHILESLSATGKSGYPKIKNKEDILNVKLYKVNISEEKLTRRIMLYDEIYEEII